MANRVKRKFSDAKNRLGEFLGGSFLKSTTSQPKFTEFSFPVKPTEERRKEALDHLVKRYFETKKREEELREKLENYGRIKRWFYQRKLDSAQIWNFSRDIIVKPVFIGILSFSGMFSAILATSVMPNAALLIGSIIPFPFNYPIVFLLAVCIAFSPFIISMELYRHIEMKREKKRLREEYGIII